jgi:uncharacterized protein
MNARRATRESVAERDAMLTTGKAVKVTVYLSDGAKHRGVPVYTSILDLLFKSGVAGASVFKGVAGFGGHHHMHTSHIVELSDHLPIKLEFIDSREKIEGLMPELEERCACGLIEMQETSVIVPVKR